MAWSQRIELAAGEWTEGRELLPLALSRVLLKRCELEGRRCLDVEAQDGLMSLLMTRRGASVTAAGPDSDADNVRLVQERSGSGFDYLGPAPLDRLRELTGREPFDLVFQTGITHDIVRNPDPLGVFATLRSLVREGGLLLFETTASLDAGASMHFNDAGSFSSFFQLWIPTLDCVDYLVRFMRMIPIDCCFATPKLHGGGGASVRVAVACRATPGYLAAPGDDWLGLIHFRDVLVDYGLDFDAIDQLPPPEPPVPYAEPHATPVRRGDSEAIDLRRTVLATRPFAAATAGLGHLALDHLE